MLFISFACQANDLSNNSGYQTIPEMCEELCSDKNYIENDAISNIQSSSNVVSSDSGVSAFSFMSLTWGYYIAYYVVAILLASIIFKNAKSQHALALNLKPIWWAVLVFIDPVLGILAYWAMNIIDIPALLKSRG